MICKKCGHEIPENIKFCNACGSPVEADTATQAESQTNNQYNNQTDTQANAQTSKNSANRVTEQSNTPFADPSFESDNSDDKKAQKKKKPLKTVLAIGLPILAALLVFFNWDSIVGFCIKTFGSDADYFRYVESKTIEDTADSISSFFSNVSFDPEQATTTKVKCTVSDELISIAKSNGAPKDTLEALEWLNDVTITTEHAFDGEKLQFGFDSDSRGNNLITGNMVADFNSGECYLTLPELSDEILVGDLGINNDGMRASQFTALMSDINEILPEEAVLNDLVEKYLETALDTVEDVTAEDKDMTIGSIEEECTVLEFSVDSDTLFDMSEAILKEAKDDDEIKDFLKNYVKLIKKYNPDMSDVDIDSEYTNGINELLSEIKSARKNMKNEHLFILRDYVADHRVVGRAIEVEGKEVFRYLTLHDGDDFAFEFVVPNTFEIQGKGTNDSGIVSASYDLISSNQTILTLDISDFDMDKFEEGYICGKIKITPDKELLKKEVSPAASLFLPSFEIISDHSEKNLKLTLNVFSNDTKLLGINFDTDYGKEPHIELPKGSLTENSSEWSSNFDFDSLEDALEKSGAPDIVIDGVDELKREMTRSYYDDYDYYY